MRADGTRIGLSAFGLPAREFVSLAIAAEAAGFDSIWHAEHVVVPAARASEHPSDEISPENVTRLLDDDHVLTDPFTVLGAAAARTSRIELMTGMYLAALRPPLITARATITLHGHETSYTGEYFAHPLIQMSPAPVRIPLILGGYSPVALRRAAARADGWFTSGAPGFDEVLRLRERLAQVRRAAGRTGPFDVHVRPADVTMTTIDRYAAAGFDRFVLWAHEVSPASGTGAERWSGLPDAADRLGLVPAAETTTEA